MTFNDRRSALVIATLASFLTPFMGSSVNVALPAIGDEFVLDAVTLGWVGTSFLMGAAIFVVPFGRIADIHGRKRIFTGGILLHTVASLVSALARSEVLLIAGRALQGIGAAMFFATGLAILTSVFPATERGRVLGINVAAVYLGLSLGPVLGGVLTQQLGWRSIFIISALLGIIILVTLRWLRGEWAEARGDRFDPAGVAFFSLSLMLIMYGLSTLPEGIGIWSLSTGIALLIIFLVWESNRDTPLLDMTLFKNSPTFLYSNIAALINYSATFAVTFILSLYLQYVRGLTPQSAGLLLIFQPAMMAICSPVAGRMSDTIEPRVVASIGMAIIVVGLVFFIFIGSDTPLWLIISNLLILGLGFGLFSSPNTNAVMSSVEKRSYGIAAAILGTMRLAGQMLSMGIVMLLFSLFMGRAPITPQYFPVFLHSIRVAFIVFSFLCIVGVYASMVRGKIRA